MNNKKIEALITSILFGVLMILVGSALLQHVFNSVFAGPLFGEISYLQALGMFMVPRIMFKNKSNDSWFVEAKFK